MDEMDSCPKRHLSWGNANAQEEVKQNLLISLQIHPSVDTLWVKEGSRCSESVPTHVHLFKKKIIFAIYLLFYVFITHDAINMHLASTFPCMGSMPIRALRWPTLKFN